MRTTRQSFFSSVIALVLCFSMLIGTTFAWFSDVVTSGGNIIQSGNLDINMYWSEDNLIWNNTEGSAATPIFNYDNWEPGYTEVRYIKVTNEGSLAFKYEMLLSPNGTVGKLAEVIDVSYDIVTGNEDFVAPTSKQDMGSLDKVGTLSDLISANGAVAGGVLLPANELATDYYSGEIVICVAFHMQEGAGNEYQNSSIGTTFDIKLYATQFNYESDSFGSDYDDEAAWPETPSVGNSASVEVTIDADGKVAESTTISGEGMGASIPAGVKLANGAKKLTLSVNSANQSDANVTLSDNETLRAVDVHMDGVASDNTVPMAITIDEAMPKGLNLGNYTLHHVENGETVAMTLLADGETPVHNSFSYDPATGDVVLYLASFSVIALIAETDMAWQGGVDHSWYVNAAAPAYEDDTIIYHISNADQLWSFSQIVGGMAEYNGTAIPADSFKGKVVMLTNNINLADTNEYCEDASENGKVFYPIGYYNSDKSYVKDQEKGITSGFKLFEGTFDGAGYRISNFYQNTWEMKGDHNWYSAEEQHYRDGMGLFGRVYGGTIKNLTINNFSCDGEITTTGCVAAYADHGALFENIAVVNCNPRVYNIGNGGIVGVVGWYEKEATDAKVTFRNITVDNTNKISALWGSWDVPCGGIVGTYYPTSGQSSADYPANPGIIFENCHVGAQIDVNNDVCANYQYYAYRYAGMLMGMVYENVTGEDGRVYPKMDGIVASGCTIHFGTWNDYYYCELVDNSTASYTHDYQMSRLTQIADIDVNKMKYLPLGSNKWLDISTSGRVNFVIVEKNEDGSWNHGDDSAQCYHFLNGNVWNHEEDGGTEIIDGVEVLKEDKQHLYLEFNNLVTGNGWGVTSKEIGELSGVTILDKTSANSVEKFEGRDMEGLNGRYLTSPISGRVYKVSHLFNFIDQDLPVVPGALTVSIINLDADGNVTATFTRDSGSWEDSTIVFSGGGRIRITIQDYYYCTPTSIEVKVRNYPEGSKIRNFTYDGFANDQDYHFNAQADHITTGKHGVYEFDFGYGPEVLDYAHKIDSKGQIIFTAPEDGIFTIAVASNTTGSGLRITSGSKLDENEGKLFISDGKTETLVTILEPFTLTVVQYKLQKGVIYEITRTTSECGIYYVGYVPNKAIPNDHTHTYYYETTATCTQAGQTIGKCLICGSQKTPVSAAALGHEWVKEEGYDPTCNDTGKKPGEYCVRCDEKIGCESIDKLGHSYDSEGFCTRCHANNGSLQSIAKVDFTTTKSDDYSSHYGADKTFTPKGNCAISNDKKYIVMKSVLPLPDGLAYIEFTVDAPVTLLVGVTSTNRTNTSNFELVNANGEKINEKFDATGVTGVSKTTLVYEIKEAGTYRFVCTSTDRVGRLLTMEIAAPIEKNN